MFIPIPEACVILRNLGDPYGLDLVVPSGWAAVRAKRLLKEFPWRPYSCSLLKYLKELRKLTAPQPHNISPILRDDQTILREKVCFYSLSKAVRKILTIIKHVYSFVEPGISSKFQSVTCKIVDKSSVNWY